jgi:hypothetical protein
MVPPYWHGCRSGVPTRSAARHLFVIVGGPLTLESGVADGTTFSLLPDLRGGPGREEDRAQRPRPDSSASAEYRPGPASR